MNYLQAKLHSRRFTTPGFGNIPKKRAILSSILLATVAVLTACASRAERELKAGNDALSRGDCTQAIADFEAAYEDGKNEVVQAGFIAMPYTQGHFAAERLNQIYNNGYDDFDKGARPLEVCVRSDRTLAQMWLERTAGTYNTQQAAAIDTAYNQGTLGTSGPAYSAGQVTDAISAGGTYDRSLNQCIFLGEDNQGHFFRNNCGVPATVEFYCRDTATGEFEAGSVVNLAPGATDRAPCLFPSTRLFAACPQSDGIFGPNGQSAFWQPNTPFTCKRIWH